MADADVEARLRTPALPRVMDGAVRHFGDGLLACGCRAGNLAAPVDLRFRCSGRRVVAAPTLVVCRGFSEGGSAAFDLGDDVVDGLGPDEGLRVVVPV